jgi:predicted nucleic acid-binding protein
MILYLETSHLVKLYVEESGSAKIKKLVAGAEFVATSIITYVEARAAFSRKFRKRGLNEREYETIKADLEEDWEHFFVLHATMDVAREAGRLAEKHGLRGFDALHLASAMSLGPGKDDQISVNFSSSDKTLKDAAKNEGLNIS